MKSPTSTFATILLLSGLLPGFAAACPTYTVNNTSDSGSGSLRDAVSQAAGCAGSQINFSVPSGSTITLQSRIPIGSAMTINGPGQSALTISGNGATRIFFINPGAGSTVIINNLTLANGYAVGGRSYFGGGAAGMGGAIFQYSGNLEISATTFSDNQAFGGYQVNNQAYGGGGFGGDANGVTGGSGGDLGGAPGSGGAGAGGNLDNNTGSGGSGGFGGGGAGGSVGNGGNGGFGGGGGAASAFVPGMVPGSGGFGATGGYFFTPGAGAGFGGAIFAYAGNLNLTDVQFVNNGAVGLSGALGKGGSLFVLSTANATSSFVTFTGSYAQQAGQSSQYPYGISGAYQNNLTCPGQDTADVCGIVQTGAGDLRIVQGNNQSGTTTRTLQQQFMVNTGMAGDLVTFTVVPSNGAGGTLGGASSVIVTTDTWGNAVAPPFTANNTAGNFVVTASDFSGSVNFNVSTVGCIGNPTVYWNYDTGAGTLRQAVDSACTGSTVNFNNGLTGPIVLVNRLRIDDNLTIQGPGAGTLTISGNNTTRLFFIGKGSVAINNLTLANGLAAGGNSEVGGSAAGMGGAIFQNGGNVSVSGVTFTGNTAQGGSGWGYNVDSEAGGGFGGSASGYTPGPSGDLTYPDGVGGAANPFGGPSVNSNGGFGAGGGYVPGANSGSGGFGAGAAGAGAGYSSGQSGFGGGTPYCCNNYYGAAGAGLGGAIFSRNGSLSLSNDTFLSNAAAGGANQNAQGKGGAVFILSTATATGSNLIFGNNAAAQAGQNSQSIYAIQGPYENNLQCPGEDTQDVCGILTDTSGKQTIEASLVANNKTYDGTTSATISSCTLLGVAPQDVGSVACQTSGAQFASANAGQNITVTATISLTGSAANKYVVSQSSTTANITGVPVTATIVANYKFYDGTTAATIASCALSGVLPADAGNLTCATSNAKFANAGPGNNITVTATVSLNGSALVNYYLTSTTGTTTADILPASLSACTTMPANLTSWWRGEGDASDAAGAYNGTLGGDVSFAPGRVGQAFSFDGSQSPYVSIPAAAFPYPASSAFTFETWFKTNGATGGVILGLQSAGVSAYGSGVASHTPAIYVGTDGKLYAQMFYNGFHQSISSSAVNDGNWHHVAVTYDGNNQITYLDGASIGTQSFAQIADGSSPYQFQLGTGYTSSWPATSGGWYTFNGLIDEPAVYARALAAAEVEYIVLAGGYGKCGAAANVPATLNLGQVSRYGSGTMTATVTSEGTTTLNLTSISIDAGDTAFTILTGASGDCSAGGQMQPSGQCNVRVQFLPSTTGAMSGTVTIKDNALTGNGTQTIQLSGTSTSTDGTGSACAPVATGVTAWWKGEGNATDLTGNYNATAGSQTSYATGEVGQAFSFNGNTNSSLSLPPYSIWLLDDDNETTIEAWFKTTSDGVILSLSASEFFNPAIYVGTDGKLYDTGFFTPYGYYSSGPYGTPFAVNDGQWHHIALVFTHGSTDPATGGPSLIRTTYLDGQALNSFQGAWGYGSYSLTLGNGQTGAGWSWPATNGTQFPFNGLVDEVTTYTRALSAAEVLSIAQAGSYGKCYAGDSLNTTALSFGTVNIGSQSTQTAVLSNPGNSNLTISAIAADSGDMNFAPQTGQPGDCAVGTPVAAGSSCNVRVTFAPPAPGTPTGQINITTNALANAGGVTIQLSGTAGTAAVTAQVTANSKPYDGTPAASISSCTLTGVAPADAGNVTCSAGSASFAIPNVGLGIQVVASNITLSGSAAGHYTLSSTTASTTANIAPLSVIAAVTANNKVFDGTTTATIASCALTGVLAADTANVACSAAGANFASTGPGNNIQVTASGITLSGAASGNYALSATTATTTANITLPSVSACVAAPANVSAWWTAEGNANDATGVYNGTLGGDVSFAAGRVGQAFSFDGTESPYVAIPAGAFPSQPSNSPFSFEAWFQTTTGGTILGEQNNGGAYGSNLQGWTPAIYVGTDGKLYTEMFYTGQLQPASSPSVVNDGAWHHVAVSFDGTTEVTYLDGAVIGTVTPYTQGINGTGAFQYQLGTGYGVSWPQTNGGWYTFNGLIDEAALYSRALTANDVVSIVAAGSYGKCNPQASAGSGAINFGSVGVGQQSTQTVAISNGGNAPTTISSIALDTNDSNFTVLSGNQGDCAAGTNLAPAAQCNVRVQFAPQSLGAVSGSVTVNDNAITFAGVQVITLTGTGGSNSVTASVTANNKPYDGTTSATIASCTLSGVAPGDAGSVTCSAAGASFATPGAGRSIQVTASGITLGGSAASKYVLASTTAVTTATITRLSVAATVTANNKSYDGTTNAVINSCTLTGVLPADSANVTCSAASAAFASPGPGSNVRVTASGIALAGMASVNYVLSSTTAATTASIGPANVTAAVTAANKPYDGTTAATITGCTLTGVVPADAGNVTCSAASAGFASAAPGSNIKVTASGITMSGTAAGHYKLTSATAVTTASITQAQVTASVVANNKIYDGTTAAAIQSCTLTGVLASEASEVACTVASASFASAGPGTNIQVTASGITLHGAAAGHYTLSSTTATTTASIGRITTTPSVIAANKPYDGTIAATIQSCTLSGVLPGDTGNVTCAAGAAAFASSAPGNNIQVTAHGITLSGTAAGHYILSSTQATTTANITPLNVTGSVSITAGPLVYSPSKGQGKQTFTITNTSGAAILNPIELLLAINGSAQPVGNVGSYGENPYWTLSTAALAPGGMVSVTVGFSYASGTSFTTTPTVYSGSLANLH